MLGNGRLIATCFDDGQQRLCNIRGKLRKKIWVNQGDVVLLGLREFQDGKADVIFKYSTDEARRLKQLNEIPENANIDPDPANAGNEDIAFEYAASSSDADDSSEEEEEDLRTPSTPLFSIIKPDLHSFELEYGVHWSTKSYEYMSDGHLLTDTQSAHFARVLTTAPSL